jgi:hypothetical protein
VKITITPPDPPTWEELVQKRLYQFSRWWNIRTYFGGVKIYSFWCWFTEPCFPPIFEIKWDCAKIQFYCDKEDIDKYKLLFVEIADLFRPTNENMIAEIITYKPKKII